MMDRIREHPRTLWTLCGIELWERFGFFAITGQLILWLIQPLSEGGMGWTKTDAFQLFGWFTACTYLSPLVGGYLADRFLGQRLAVAIGNLCLIAGYALLIVPTPYGNAVTGGDASIKTVALHVSLALQIAGTGLFKPNISVMVGRLYNRGDPAMDAGFTYFWTGLNIGALFASLIGGYVFDRMGAAPVHVIVTMALMLSLLTTLVSWKNLSAQIDATAIFDVKKTQSINLDSNRIFLITIVILLGGIFNSIFQQLNILITVFTDERVDHNLLGFHIPTLWLISLNQISILLCVPLVAAWWARRDGRGLRSSAFFNFSIAFAVMTLTFGILAIMSGDAGRVGMAGPAFAIFLTGIAEIFVQPIGLAMATRLAPPHYAGPIMGCWFLAYAFAYYASAQLGVLSTVIGDQRVFILTCIASLAVTVILMLLRRPLERRLAIAEQGSAPV
jgi:proton-dependent oligopeptide transporter, POT family